MVITSSAGIPTIASNASPSEFCADTVRNESKALPGQFAELVAVGENQTCSVRRGDAALDQDSLVDDRLGGKLLRLQCLGYNKGYVVLEALNPKRRRALFLLAR